MVVGEDEPVRVSRVTIEAVETRPEVERTLIAEHEDDDRFAHRRSVTGSKWDGKLALNF